MNQLSFADTEFTSKRRKTRKELFLGRMDELIPWQQLEDQIDPFYPKAGNGRRPYPLSTMLRIHFMQKKVKPNKYFKAPSLNLTLICLQASSHGMAQTWVW